MAIYENLSPNGHYTMAQRIFYKISLLLNRKIRTISYEDFQLLSQAEKDDGTQWCVYGAPDTTVLKYYPVGSYYETSDTTFDPNTEWGGTWVLETEGLVHISSGSHYAVTTNAQDGGEATHKLLISEIPNHTHAGRLRGGANNDGGNSAFATGKVLGYQSNYNSYWPTEGAGGDQPHNNMQPYKIVNRWHRTA